MSILSRLKQTTLVFVAVSIFGAVSFAAVFGSDDRHSLTPNSPKSAMGRSIAISILSETTTLDANGDVSLLVDPLNQLCKDEKFAGEPSSSFACTGFLVGPDLLVTAGHCLYAVNTPNQELVNETGLACAVFDWLFDYQTGNDGKIQTTGISKSRFYHCKKIIYAVQQEHAPFLDYALIQLDREVVGRTPFKLATSQLTHSDTFSMIGFPFGTTMKYTDNGRLLLNDLKRSSFITNLDAFEGNSGSPVINSQGEVTGILIAGTPMDNTYVDSSLQCDRFNRCDEDGSNCKSSDPNPAQFPGFQKTGSEVQRISPILELLKANKSH